ncbi:MAG: thioredoxin family protein, partial [Alphaproteobacteria bacterium]|nr:thioredoxin family protein [Alphaproteobacteria bacterium]
MRFFIIVILTFVICLPSSSLGEELHRNVQIRMFSSVEAVGRLKTVPVGIEVKLAPGWKMYWRTPGEAGLAPVFNWTDSENVKDVKIQWPYPTRFVTSDIDNYGYENKVTFPTVVTPLIPGEPVILRLGMDLLICNEICIPESFRLSFQIPAGEAKISVDGQSTLAEAFRRIPRSDDEENFSIKSIGLKKGDNKKIRLYVEALSMVPLGADADMFVEHSTFISVGKPVFSYDSATQKLILDAPIRSKEKVETLEKTLRRGSITITVTDHDHAFERSGVLEVGVVPDMQRERIDVSFLFMAFLGGLILNLMPCVLPVLSLKILSVMCHGGKDHRIHRWQIFRNFMASAVGIIFSFLLMAEVLVALKAAGRSIGWGIQFQHPGFLIFLIVVLAVFAANMWGLFEISLPWFIAKNMPVRKEHEPTLIGHFLTGAFATLLATPCSAPFLGTAIGFALAGGEMDILIVFTFLGFGMASPYMVLALSPRLFRYMPKPGKWMVTLKKILALALVFTALWLFSVLVALVSAPVAPDDGWVWFDEALIEPAVEEGRIVVVNVTADWCLTCKVNESMAFGRKEVRKILSGSNVLCLQADWTHRDEKIAAYLRKYGKFGIPFNIIYGPGVPEGIILGELFGKQAVINALLEA